MKYSFLISLIFLQVGCASLKPTTRDISSDLSPEEELAITPEMEAKGAKEPWKFVQAHLYCSDNNKFLKNYQELIFPLAQYGDQDKAAFRKAVLQANTYTFRTLACDSKYKSIVSEIFKASSGWTYYPGFRSENDPKRSYYLVTKYESMAFNYVSSGMSNDIASKVVLKNPERQRKKINLRDISLNYEKFTDRQPDPQIQEKESSEDFDRLRKFGNIGFSLPTKLNAAFCLTRIYNLINKQEIDQVWTTCTSEIPAEPVQINSQWYLLYVDYAGFENQEENIFKVKLHRVTGRKVHSDFIQSYAAALENQKQDRIILSLKSQKQPSANVEEAAVPTEILVRSQENGKNLLTVNLLSEGQNEVQIFEFNKNFEEPTLKHLVPLEPNTFVRLFFLHKGQLEMKTASKGGELFTSLFDLESGKLSHHPAWISPGAERVLEGLVQRVFLYPTKDGRKIPLSVTYKKNFKAFSPKNFGLLSGYGGFNEIMSAARATPAARFQPIFEKGGFIATAMIRGGGDLGPRGWREAYGKNREVSFQDFISAAEFLNERGFAPKKRIVSEGWSNGGLLVLATAMMRPDLFAAVVSGSPVTDLLNLERLDPYAGSWQWSDYGTLDDPETKAFWEKMSPLQNLAKINNLPPILLRTVDGDPNVHSYHAISMFGQLTKRKDANKFFLYVQPYGEDHNPATTRAIIEEYSYIQSFIFRQLGL